MRKKEMIHPAMARPRGALNTPITENIAPRSHRMKSRTGTQQRIIAISESTNPAVPRALPFFCTMIVWGLVCSIVKLIMC